MAFAKTTAGKEACSAGTTVSTVGGFMGQLGGTAGGGKIIVGTAAMGSTLATWTLPALTDSGGGLITMSGTPPVATPGNAGVAAAYTTNTSVPASLGQGTVTATGGGGDMTVNNTTFATTSNVTLSTFTHQEN